MRILHTSDWHLGQEFHEFNRESEHAAFLTWLEETLVAEQVDALLVAGDIYDSQNPPITAQRQLYHFIARVRQRLPKLDMVLVGGNHDSAGRLEAPGPLLDVFGARVVGSLSRTSENRINAERLAVPLHDATGKVAAICAAVPFLRPSDLPPVDTDKDALIEGVRQVYADILASITADLLPDQSLVVTGHCYMTGSEISEISERRILGGNQHALPVDIFPDTVTYVALGHLHKAQKVGGRDHVRYSGSPLPLSVTERSYKHQVLLVDLAGPHATVTPLPVPRWTEIIRIPAHGTATVDAALAQLKSLVLAADLPPDRWPFMHICVSSDAPIPAFRRDVDEAIAGKPIRLASIETTHSQNAASLAPHSLPGLDQVHPEDIFCRCWRGTFQNDPPPEYLAAFRHLLESVETHEGAS